MLKVEHMINECKKILKRQLLQNGTDMNNPTAQMMGFYTYFEQINWLKNTILGFFLCFFKQDWRRLNIEASSHFYTCSPGWGLKEVWKPACSCAGCVFSAHIWLLFETYSSGTSGPLQLDWGVRDRSRDGKSERLKKAPNPSKVRERQKFYDATNNKSA